MNWDKEAEDYATAHHTCEHRSEYDKAFGNLIFGLGAKWQRDQLRTDEALELTARAILDAKYLTTWDKACAWEKDNAFHAARAAITALIGEEP